MKYRIKQIGTWYYPQYKEWFFWNTIQTLKANKIGRLVLVDDKKLSIEESLKSISLHKNKKNKAIIHEVN